jgi:hypothetical protein
MNFASARARTAALAFALILSASMSVAQPSLYCVRKLDTGNDIAATTLEAKSSPQRDCEYLRSSLNFVLLSPRCDGLVFILASGERFLLEAGDGFAGYPNYGVFDVHWMFKGHVNGAYESPSPEWVYVLGYSVKVERLQERWQFRERIEMPTLFTRACDSPRYCMAATGAYSASLKRVFYRGSKISGAPPDDDVSVEVVANQSRILADPVAGPLFYVGDATSLGLAVLRDRSGKPYAYDGLSQPVPVAGSEGLKLDGRLSWGWELRDKPEIGRTEFFRYGVGYFLLTRDRSLLPVPSLDRFRTETPSDFAIPGTGERWLFTDTGIYLQVGDETRLVASPPANRRIRPVPFIGVKMPERWIEFSTADLSGKSVTRYALEELRGERADCAPMEFLKLE